MNEKEKNLGQSIWNKSVRTYWGTCWELGKPFGNRKKLKIFLSPQPKFGVPRVEIGPIESTLHVIDFCVLFKHYYKQDVKYSFKGDKTFLLIILQAKWVYGLVYLYKIMGVPKGLVQ